MRRRTSLGRLVLAALVLSTAPAAGQELRIGGEAGINVSDLDFGREAGPEAGSIIAFRGGAVVRLDLGSRLGLQGGLYRVERGTDDPVPVPVVVGGDAVLVQELELELTHLDVPLLLTLSFPTGSPRIEPRVHAGGRLTIETGCEVSTAAPGGTFSADCGDPGVGLSTGSSTVALVLGGGVDLEAGPGAVTVDVRYGRGFAEVVALETDLFTPEAPTIGGSHDDVALSVGYVVGSP